MPIESALPALPLSLLGELEATVWLLLALLTPGVIAAIFWSPLLLADRFRSLFRRLPPGGTWYWSYGLVTVGLSLPYVLGLVWALVQTSGGTGAEMAEAILNVAFPISMLYLFGLPVLAAYGLPRMGLDWDPEQYGASTWFLLFVGAGWFVLLFGAPIFFIVFFLALPL